MVCGGRPLPLTILAEIDPISLKTPISNQYSLVALQAYT